MSILALVRLPFTIIERYFSLDHNSVSLPGGSTMSSTTSRFRFGSFRRSSKKINPIN